MEGFLPSGEGFHKEFVGVSVFLVEVIGAQDVKKLSANFTMTRMAVLLIGKMRV